MGIAAYNRGTEEIRRQIDRETKPTDPAIFARWWSGVERDRAYSRIASLESDLASARKCITRLRAERSVVADELKAQQRLVDVYRNMLLSSFHTNKRARCLIDWLKGLLSFAGVTVAQRDAYERELAEDGKAYRLGPFAERENIE